MVGLMGLKDSGRCIGPRKSHSLRRMAMKFIMIVLITS